MTKQRSGIDLCGHSATQNKRIAAHDILRLQHPGFRCRDVVCGFRGVPAQGFRLNIALTNQCVLVSCHFSRSILASMISLFLLWIAPPRLVRLSMGALIGILSGINFGGLFAHRAFLRLYINESSNLGFGSRGRNETTICHLVGHYL